MTYTILFSTCQNLRISYILKIIYFWSEMCYTRCHHSQLHSKLQVTQYTGIFTSSYEVCLHYPKALPCRNPVSTNTCEGNVKSIHRKFAGHFCGCIFEICILVLFIPNISSLKTNWTFQLPFCCSTSWVLF